MTEQPQRWSNPFGGTESVNRIARALAAGLAVVLAAGGVASARPGSDGTAAFAREDYVVAARKVVPLAERGDPNAQAMLGFMHEHGRGVPQNYGAAVHWYTCAAEQGHPTAQYLLGLMYDKGLGVVRSDVLAYMWLNLAAAHAPRPVREYYLRLRNVVAFKLTAAQIAKAQWLAYNFVPKRLP
jgi:uncharacterized protein